LGIGKLLPDASFSDLSGTRGSLRDFRGSVLVVSVTSIGCPISKKLTPALSRLPDSFQDDSVEFLLLNTDLDSEPSALLNHAEQFPGWRYVDDKDTGLARVLEARSTTETFVIDRAQTLRYRGSVDDRFDVGVVRETIGAEYLRDAIVSVLGREKLNTPSTGAPGCILGFSRPAEDARPITWYNQISRFVQFNCVECHRPGEVAPFSLEKYQQVLSKKAMIKYVLEEGIMPPWFADPSHGDFRNSRVVSDAEREMFNQWVESGSAKGDPADAPIPIEWDSGWTIGKPDLIIDVEPQEVPAEGVLPWRKFPLPFEVKEDLWVSAAEIRPSEPEVVHHAMLYVEYAQDDPRRRFQMITESETSGGGRGFWLSYFPGRKSMNLRPGQGKLIPRNGRIFVQLHYNANGQAHVDNPRIGFKLLDSPPETVVMNSSVRHTSFVIPPNSRAEFVTSEVFAEDVRLLALMPHMHYRGSAAEVFLKHADGRVEFLLDIPKYDFDWQISYEFRKPLLVIRGSRMVIRHQFDNTEDNLNNPDATQTLTHGSLTTDEMMINFFDWEPVGEDPPSGRNYRPFL
jgi:hypothetical protein